MARASDAGSMDTPTAEDVRSAFDREGYWIARGLLDQGSTELLARILRAELHASIDLQSRTDREGHQTRLALRNALGDDAFSALARSEQVAGRVQDLLGEEIYHYHHKLMVKEPRVGGAWEWHQDYGYWYENGCLRPDMASCLMAIGPSTVENGCLRVVPGSHALGRLDHGRVSEQAGADPARVDAIRDRLGERAIEMNPGDALFFHCNLLHRSDRNRSDEPRLSCIACYNTRRNDPIREHHHPRFTPLEIAPASELSPAIRSHAKRLGLELPSVS